MGKSLDVLPQAAGRVLTLDFIKAVCIVLVILRHVPFPVEIQKAMLYPFTILPAVPMFLMCSVYAFCLTEDRKNGDFWLWFSRDIFWKRVNRFLLPFLFTVVLTILGLFLFRGMKTISLEVIFKMLLQGGRGPANYYVVVIFQFLILFPFLRFCYKKSPSMTILFLVASQIAYETLCSLWTLEPEVYYVLIFRYFTHLALGFLLYTYKDKFKGTALPAVCIMVGAIYLIQVYYLGYQQVLVYDYPLRSMIAVLYSFGVLCYLFRLEDWLQKVQHRLQPVFYIGKASFHIMLAQMVYFYFARLDKFESKFDSLLIVVAVDLTISITAGCLFYWADEKVRNIVKQ